jgi:hypothetical protein
VPAYAAFEKNRELVQEAEEAIDSIVTREGAARVVTILKEYTDSLSKQMSSVADAAVKDQVENEVVAIEDYVRRMETLS